MLRCPICHSELNKLDNTYKCLKGHSFDIAKSGYTNLLVNKKHTGDNKEMSKARNDFFKNDYYHVLKIRLYEIIKELNIKTLVDAGCGEGYYTNYLSDNLDLDIYAFDMSKYSLNYGAKANKKVNYLASSIFDLPLIDNSIDLILSIFAPVAYEEFYRVLKDEGYFIKVSPLERHLWELKEAIYDKPYENDNKYVAYEGFNMIKEYHIKDRIIIDNLNDIKALFMMTPYYFHTSKEDVTKLDKLNELEVTLEFKIELYQKKK